MVKRLTRSERKAATKPHVATLKLDQDELDRCYTALLETHAPQELRLRFISKGATFRPELRGYLTTQTAVEHHESAAESDKREYRRRESEVIYEGY
jgi:hypothetical protein